MIHFNAETIDELDEPIPPGRWYEYDPDDP